MRSPRTGSDPATVSEADGLEHLVRSYLRGFGPAPLRDISGWAGVPVASLKPAAEGMGLRELRDESGGVLLDLPDGAIPAAGVPAPVRFLPHWDANLLVHARRTQLLPEEYRARVFSTKNPFSVGVFLVDGVTAGAWTLKDGHVQTEPFATLGKRAAREVEAEAERLDAFCASATSSRRDRARRSDDRDT